jgi:hypothetical protein
MLLCTACLGRCEHAPVPGHPPLNAGVATGVRANAHKVARAWSIFDYPTRNRELSSPVSLKSENRRQDAYRKYPTNAHSIRSHLIMDHPASTQVELESLRVASNAGLKRQSLTPR